MTSGVYTIYDLFFDIFGIIKRTGEKRISKNKFGFFHSSALTFHSLRNSRGISPLSPLYYVSSDYLEARLDGSGSCINSSNSAINAGPIGRAV